MSEIKVLSKEVSELIAAGEVIDRPASIIKELLENAIDAGANVITVEIKNGGRTYIRVTDNGKGISPDDLPTAFLRHATSKISDKNDLDSIMTLGFRGEALASICAVAKVDVLTKRVADEYGTHYVIEGTEEKCFEQSGCPNGTTFVVRDIFYNVPARLKFLKKDSSEGNHVADLVTKLTLSHPEISFKFIRDNKPEILTAGDGKNYSAVYSVYGREFANSLLDVDYTWNGIHVSGFTVKPLCSKPNRKFQNFFVNKRYVKSKACAAALEEAYRNSIMTGKFPACVLYIDIPPNTVDVNVHPTKIEVRFSDEKLMHEAVFFAVKNALMVNDKPTEIVLENKRNFTDRQLYDFPNEDKSVQMQFSVEESSQTPPVPDDIPLPEPPPEKQFEPVVTKVENIPVSEEDKSKGADLFLSSLENKVENKPDNRKEEEPPKREKLTVEEINRIVSEIPLPAEPEENNGDFRFLDNASFKKKPEKKSVIVEKTERENPKPVVIGELFKTYVVAQAGDEMILMDKHAAHERYIFEKIKNNANELETQMLLEPVMVLLSYDEFDALAANLEKVKKLGFEIEPDVAPTVAVMGVPIILGDENPTDIVTDLAKNFIDNKLNPQLEIFDDLYHSIACKAAIKANDSTGTIELQALLNAVYGNDNIRYCPHGRPVMITLSKKDIEKQFKRVL
jgi:DNA mismatch repair protein MutL